MVKNILKISAFLLGIVLGTACVQETPVDPSFSIEGDRVSYSVDFNEVTQSNAEVFVVRSNQPWELVATEEYDWIKPFPGKGEGDGRFIFVIEANNSTESREAIYSLVVGGETQPTVFTVTQGPRGEFVKAAENSFTLGFEEALLELKVERNVEIELYTISDDSDMNGSWITLAADQPAAEDSLHIKVAESTLLSPRTASVAIRMKNDPTVADTLTIFQAGTQELYGFPAVWNFNGRQAEQPYKDNWEVKNSVPADEGLGFFSYVHPDPINNDGNNKFKRTIGGTGDPYVTGAWPGDYWLYEVPAVVPANTLFNISFSGRVSGTGHKFWMLEYLDGENWKPIGTVLTTEETGETVEYTNAMQNANAPIGGSFKVKNAMNSLKVRYRCMANWQSSGAGALAARNGGTSRMTGDDGAILKIEVLGTNVGDAANVTMSAQHVALEGAAGSEGTFTFTSSESWALTTTCDWIEFTPAQGVANEETTVTVKALTANETGALRKANLVLNAGMSVIDVAVVQGAAGSILSPFISVVGGNYYEVTPDANTYTVDIQSNVAYTATSETEWITIVPAAETKALVEVTPLTFSVEQSTGDARTGKIVLKNEEEGLETILYVVQKKAPLYVEWLFSADAMSDYTDTFTGTFKTAGDNGLYVAANVKGNGKITYVQIDKTTLDKNSKAKQVVGSTGHPTANGCWPGDYWLFEASDGETYPAGTKVNIDYITRTSATGMKYWRVEYLDGEEWKPAFATTPGTTKAGETVEYNVIMNADGKTNVHVDCTVTYSSPVSKVQFRMLCLANDQAQGEGALAAPNGGTCRIAGAAGTSPVIRVVTE